jgi:hypothetical protein
MPDQPWYRSLPPAVTRVPCSGQQHEVRWQDGALELTSHPDPEAEMVLAALGGNTPECVEVAQSWEHSLTNLDLLMTLPRSATDRLNVTWEEVEAFRAPQRSAITLSGRTATPLPTSLPPNAPPRMRQLRAEAQRARSRHLKLLRVLALGHEFQVRLAGSIAVGAGAASPALAAALAGRTAPAIARWLGINPDDVTVAVHTGPGWGTLYAAGDEAWMALPVNWLWDVWACGLEQADGQFVVAVTEPGWPEAKVLALREPGSKPVEVTAHRGPH